MYQDVPCPQTPGMWSRAGTSRPLSHVRPSPHISARTRLTRRPNKYTWAASQDSSTQSSRAQDRLAPRLCMRENIRGLHLPSKTTGLHVQSDRLLPLAAAESRRLSSLKRSASSASRTLA
eukprot:4103543-Prymnesium_polylepis.1